MRGAGLLRLAIEAMALCLWQGNSFLGMKVLAQRPVKVIN